MRIDIQGYEGLYSINEDGLVLSIKRNLEQKQALAGAGYPYVTLYKNGKRANKYIHRLLAIHFIPNPENKPEVNHKNGIKHDNRIGNLEWATHSENQQHAVDTGLHRIGALHPQARAIIQKSTDNTVLKEWGSIKECSRALNIHTASIIACCKNPGSKKYATAYGFKWQYK